MLKNDQIEIIKYVTNNLIVEGDNEDKKIFICSYVISLKTGMVPQ